MNRRDRPGAADAAAAAAGRVAGERRVFQNSLSELAGAGEWLRSFAVECGLTHEVTHDLDLALHEVLTNIISYAYRDNGHHEITVVLREHSNRISVVIEDDGVPFNPLGVPPAHPAATLDQSPPSGRGLSLMRSLVDELQYARRDGKNVLTMIVVLDDPFS